MSKAILLIDMPKNCYECKLRNYHFCDVTDNCVTKFVNENSKPDWCPLKALPERYNNSSSDDSHYYYMCTGWNSCIDEILSQ